MKAAQYLRLIVIGAAMPGAGNVLADDLPLPAESAQRREKMRGETRQDRTAYRAQMPERVRNMMPEEQKRMRETHTDARARTQSQPGEETRQRSGDGSAQGGGYGQGYESRRAESGGSSGQGMSGGRGR